MDYRLKMLLGALAYATLWCILVYLVEVVLAGCLGGASIVITILGLIIVWPVFADFLDTSCDYGNCLVVSKRL